MDTYDTMKFIHPDSVVGETCKQQIRLEADELDAGEIRLAQRSKFLELFDGASEDGIDYEIFEGLLYSGREPSKYSASYPRLVLPSKFREKVISCCHANVSHQSVVKTLSSI